MSGSRINCAWLGPPPLELFALDGMAGVHLSDQHDQAIPRVTPV